MMAESTEAISVGIDLGTTNSCIAIVEGRNVTIICDNHGRRTMPSMFTYTDDGEFLVGWNSFDQAYMYPHRNIYEVKRLMGQNFDNREVQKFKNQCDYNIIQDDNIIQIQIDDIEFYPEEISARVLEELKRTAAEYTHKNVTKAVITVPAYFADSQRNATKEAAYLAGFESVYMINEPTAAALAFQHNNPKDKKRNILIYDFGGGTFDVTVAKVEGTKCDVLATKGDCFLGGTDIDMNIVNYIKANINKQTDKRDRMLRRMKTFAEDAKKKLSLLQKYEIEILRNQSIFITREIFENINKKLFIRTIDIAKECVKDAGLKLENIDEIVLVGGSTKIPKVREMIQNAFKNSRISRTINPDEAVAYGAALFATRVYENNPQIYIKDVLSLSLGIEADSGKMHFILKRNTPIPCEHTETFAVSGSKFFIKLYQGESLIAQNNHYLNQCIIDNKHMLKQIRVKFSFDEGGNLTLTAQSSTRTEIKIDMTKYKLNEEETNRLINYEKNTENELKVLRYNEKKRQFDFYCENLKRRLQDHHRRKKIMEKINDFKKTIKKFSLDDVNKFDEFTGVLEAQYNKPKTNNLNNMLARFGFKKLSATIIGIDLGTTNSCVAYLKNGKVELIEDENYGTYLIPSVVTFDKEKKVLIGSSAVEVAHMYKCETIYEAKRLIGQAFDDPKVQEDIKKFPFIVKNDLDSPKIVIKNNIWNEELFVEDVSKYVLEYLVNTARKRLQTEITEAVITIPAYFGNEQRTATKDAASLAGIKTAHIINEPTAAALAFQFANSSKFERHLLIYDFGGGTFDVCVVRTRDRHCEVLTVDGDCHLGGTDIDSNLVSFLKADILQKCGQNIKDDDWKTCRRLKNLAEKAKKYLSSNYKYGLELNLVQLQIEYETEITRQQFEKLNKHLFQKTIELAEKCVADAKLRKEQIDQVILVGGSSRIPMVRDMLKACFGDKINSSINPDQMVAYGAAVFASTLGGNKSEITFQDVLTLSLGTDVRGNKMSNIINRNTSLPCEQSKRYITTYDNQTEMSVKIYQGERVLASQNSLLGEVCVTDLTEAPEGKVIVEVKFSVNEEGILNVTAKELNTENIRNLDIDMKNTRTSKTDIEKRIKDAETERDSDEAQVVLTNKKFEFEKFCETLEESAGQFENDRANDILRQIDAARNKVQSLNTEQIEEIDDITKQLTQLFETK